jgi:hypothetical protein
VFKWVQYERSAHVRLWLAHLAASTFDCFDHHFLKPFLGSLFPDEAKNYFSIRMLLVCSSRSVVRCNNSASGLDGIKFIMFKFFPEKAKRYLLGIFNEIMSTALKVG